jgi:hypothetical protein
MRVVMDYLSIIGFFVLIGLALALGSRSHNIKNISTSHFENHFVSFNYPNNLTVVDESTKDNCKIYLFNGAPIKVDSNDPKCIGDISTTVSNFASSITDPIKDLDINGTPAIEYHHNVLSNELFIPSKSILLELNTNTLQTNSKLIFFDLYSNASQTNYDIIKNSLTIK